MRSDAGRARTIAIASGRVTPTRSRITSPVSKFIVSARRRPRAPSYPGRRGPGAPGSAARALEPPLDLRDHPRRVDEALGRREAPRRAAAARDVVRDDRDAPAGRELHRREPGPKVGEDVEAVLEAADEALAAPQAAHGEDQLVAVLPRVVAQRAVVGELPRELGVLARVSAQVPALPPRAHEVEVPAVAHRHVVVLAHADLAQVVDDLRRVVRRRGGLVLGVESLG